MTSKSLFIPAQKDKRPESVYSNASSSSALSHSWSNTFSLDQLSLYSKKKTFGEQEEKKKRRQQERIKQIARGFNQVLLLSLNDCSLGLYRVIDHVSRRVPKIIDARKKLQSSSQKVKAAILDIKDVRNNVCELEQIDSFFKISQMIEQSISLTNKQHT
ncbi:hypothetical protein BD560DRAFT_415855 [Blakeslea trispora]|nr:hypothetical protein BD560DRAFT_415855 [Blakeslea trispora]